MHASHGELLPCENVWLCQSRSVGGVDGGVQPSGVWTVAFYTIDINSLRVHLTSEYSETNS